jgi:hypothetical protein
MLLLVMNFGWPTLIPSMGVWIFSMLIPPIVVIRHNGWAPKTPPR